MQLFDTHAHLLKEGYPGGVSGVLERARQAQVTRCITVATQLDDSRASVTAAADHEGLWCTVGVHPHEAAKMPCDFVQELDILASEPKVVAIGETGLDYHYEHSPRPRQQEVFADQLELARRRDLAVVIHCREAFEDCLAILDDWDNEQARVVFHCFSSDTAAARQVLDRGYFLSFTGIITFDNAREVQAAASYAPIDRIMLETDCPFLSPAPKRGHWPNEPALLPFTAEKMAQLRGQTAENIAEATTATAVDFFRLEQP
jgi:TatD DNase family protein